MPFVSVQHMERAFTGEQQQQLIRDITDAFVRARRGRHSSERRGRHS